MHGFLLMDTTFILIEKFNDRLELLTHYQNSLCSVAYYKIINLQIVEQKCRFMKYCNLRPSENESNLFDVRDESRDINSWKGQMLSVDSERQRISGQSYAKYYPLENLC